MQSDQPVEPAETGMAQPATDAVAAAATTTLDLDGIGQDLADVEAALARLDAGTYWADEITGAELSEDLLAEHPTARRSPLA